MRTRILKAIILVLTLPCCAQVLAANLVSAAESNVSAIASSDVFLLAPPKEAVPIVVSARFDLYDINEINEEMETFEFTGVLRLRWKDPRQAFDPTATGVDEKVFQGDYQFNELSTGWYPQVVLVNQAGSYQQLGVVLRIQPDGVSTLVATVNATAETELDMRRFPFDGHRLKAVFEVLGFDRDEIRLQVDSDKVNDSSDEISVPQWNITAVESLAQDHSSRYAGPDRVSSALIMVVDVQRNSFYAIRLVAFPLIVIVLLSFSVFWMERSSLGDRISVSFIGILTGVSYQIVTSASLPHISYMTLMHGFLNASFMMMCLTVVINLAVGALDKHGKYELGDRVDRNCRWIFPLVYFGLLVIMAAVTFVFF